MTSNCDINTQERLLLFGEEVWMIELTWALVVQVVDRTEQSSTGLSCWTGIGRTRPWIWKVTIQFCSATAYGWSRSSLILSSHIGTARIAYSTERRNDQLEEPTTLQTAMLSLDSWSLIRNTQIRCDNRCQVEDLTGFAAWAREAIGACAHRLLAVAWTGAAIETRIHLTRINPCSRIPKTIVVQTWESSVIHVGKTQMEKVRKARVPLHT